MEMKELIGKGETQNLEFKESLKLKDEIGETISAFSNFDGGVVLVGISDDGGVLGVDIGKNTVEELASYIKRNTDPQIFPSVKTVEVGEKKLIAVEVTESAEKPVFFKNHGYKRVGKTNQRISSSELRKLAKESGERVYWDERVCEDAGLEDVNKEKVEWFLKTRFTKRKVAIPFQMRFEEVLMNLGSAKRTDKEVKLTNAGILVFCRYPQRFIPLRILCARFRGVDLSRTTIDSLDCSGTLVEIMEQTEEFIRRNMRLFGFRTSFSFRRIDKLEYPIEALNNQIYREINGVSDETTRLELSQLVDKELLKIKGKGRSTKYVPLVGD